MNHIIGDRLKDGMARDLRKLYEDICNTYGLVVHKDCKSYVNDIWHCSNNHGIGVLYENRSLTILYLYFIRYIKLVRPSFYRDNRETIIYHNNFKKDYKEICYRLPKDIIDEWVKLLKEAKF
jgi:hypothetical protein